MKNFSRIAVLLSLLMGLAVAGNFSWAGFGVPGGAGGCGGIGGGNSLGFGGGATGSSAGSAGSESSSSSSSSSSGSAPGGASAGFDAGFPIDIPITVAKHDNGVDPASIRFTATSGGSFGNLKKGKAVVKQVASTAGTITGSITNKNQDSTIGVMINDSLVTTIQTTAGNFSYDLSSTYVGTAVAFSVLSTGSTTEGSYPILVTVSTDTNTTHPLLNVQSTNELGLPSVAAMRGGHFSFVSANGIALVAQDAAGANFLAKQTLGDSPVAFVDLDNPVEGEWFDTADGNLYAVDSTTNDILGINMTSALLSTIYAAPDYSGYVGTVNLNNTFSVSPDGLHLSYNVIVTQSDGSPSLALAVYDLAAGSLLHTFIDADYHIHGQLCAWESNTVVACTEMLKEALDNSGYVGKRVREYNISSNTASNVLTTTKRLGQVAAGSAGIFFQCLNDVSGYDELCSAAAGVDSPLVSGSYSVYDLFLSKDGTYVSFGISPQVSQNTNGNLSTIQSLQKLTSSDFATMISDSKVGIYFLNEAALCTPALGFNPRPSIVTDSEVAFSCVGGDQDSSSQVCVLGDVNETCAGQTTSGNSSSSSSSSSSGGGTTTAFAGTYTNTLTAVCSGAGCPTATDVTFTVTAPTSTTIQVDAGLFGLIVSGTMADGSGTFNTLTGTMNGVSGAYCTGSIVSNVLTLNCNGGAFNFSNYNKQTADTCHGSFAGCFVQTNQSDCESKWSKVYENFMAQSGPYDYHNCAWTSGQCRPTGEYGTTACTPP